LVHNILQAVGIT